MHKVLAALDVHTARWVVEKCFKGDLIRGRTVLLVVSEYGSFTLSLLTVDIPLQTHNVAMASPLADYVVSFSRDGRVASHGSALNAVAESLTVSPELVEGTLNEEKRTDDQGLDATAKQADGKLIVAEEIAEGQVSWDACNCQFYIYSGCIGKLTLV
jgi:hypothetical protein